MPAQFKLEDLTSAIEKAVQPGLLSRLLGKDSAVPKGIADFLKNKADLTPEAGQSPADQTLQANASRSDIISTILGALGSVSASPFAEIARENVGRNVLVTTSREVVEGVVGEVGHGYVVLTEAGGSTVTVNFRNTQAFQPSPVGVDSE